MDYDVVLDCLSYELDKALTKYPTFNSAHEGFAVLKEEVDELWEVVREKQSNPGREDRLQREALQVAAMAVRFLIDMPDFKN